MLGALTTLLVFQLIGEVLVQALALPVPGPVVGMLLLFIAAHGIGTARAVQVSEETGKRSRLGMGLNGLATAVLTPLLVAALRLF